MKAARCFVLTVVVLALTVPSFGWPRVRLGGITVGVGYTHYSGRFYPYYYDPFYSPYGYPYWGSYYGAWAPFYGPGYGWDVRSATKGEVRLASSFPDAEVYINGAYAGPVRKLRTMWLDPGAYDLEVRPANQPVAQKRVYVLSGKKLDVRLAEVRR